MKKTLHCKNSPTALTSNEINSFMRITPQYTTDDYEGSNKLLNKSIVVTASDNGVGKAVSIAFAKEGANIVMVYNHLKQEKELKKQLKSLKIWAGKFGFLNRVLLMNISAKDFSKIF